MEALSKNLSLAEKLKYMKDYKPRFCKNLNKYENLKKIGQGTYGFVNFCLHLLFFIQINFNIIFFDYFQDSIQSQRKRKFKKYRGDKTNDWRKYKGRGNKYIEKKLF